MTGDVKQPLTFRALLAAAGSLFAALAFAQGALEIIALRHRTVDQVIPVLRPLLEPGGSLSGQGTQLFVRTSPRNLADLRAALDALDRPARRLVISVRYEDAGASARSGVGVTNQGVRIVESRGASDDRVDQRVQVIEGGRAFIASGQSRPVQQRQVIRTPGGVVVQDSTAIQDIATGFEVVPRIAGQNVLLEIAPQRETPGRLPGSVQGQRAATTVTAAFGQWVELGGTDTGSARDGSGILSSSQSQSSSSRRVLVRVDEVPN